MPVIVEKLVSNHLLPEAIWKHIHPLNLTNYCALLILARALTRCAHVRDRVKLPHWFVDRHSHVLRASGVTDLLLNWDKYIMLLAVWMWRHYWTRSAGQWNVEVNSVRDMPLPPIFTSTPLHNTEPKTCIDLLLLVHGKLDVYYF